MPANTWTWVDYQNGNTSSKINVSLTAGTHTLTMAGREAGVEVDRIEAVADTTCVPTGTGDNCASVTDPNAKPDLVVTAIQPSSAQPRASVTFSATVKNQGTTATPSGTTIGVSFWVDGTKVSWSDDDSTSLAPGASVTLTANTGSSGSAIWTATSGNHTVEARVNEDAQIAELNTSNNLLDSTFVVSIVNANTGDTNNDGHIIEVDLSALLSHDGKDYAAADFNHDGTVGAADLAILLAHWTW
jgi:hypothetical protein